MTEKKKKTTTTKQVKAKKESKKPVKKPAKKAVSHKPVSHKPEEKFKEVKAPTNVIRWKAPDYYTFEKSPYWSLGVGLLAIILSLILIYTNNFFPVIIVILTVIITFQVAHEKPKTEEFAVDEGGVLSRNEYLPYTELKSFWIAKHGKKSILYLEPLGRFRGPIAIPLGEQSTAEVRVHLLRFLPERLEYGEMFSDKLIRIFRL